MKYDHVRFRLMSGFSESDGRFYIIDKNYFFKADVIRDEILFHPLFLNNNQGFLVYQTLIDLSLQASKLSPVIFSLIRMHLIILHTNKIYETYFLPYNQSCLFYGNEFILNSVEQMALLLPFSNMLLNHFNMTEFAEKLYAFLTTAESIDLFSLSKQMMLHLYNYINTQD